MRIKHDGKRWMVAIDWTSDDDEVLAYFNDAEDIPCPSLADAVSLKRDIELLAKAGERVQR